MGRVIKGLRFSNSKLPLMFGTRLPVRRGVGGVQGPPGARPEPAEHDPGLQLGLGEAARRHAAVAHVSAGPHRHGAQLPHPPRQQPVLPLALCNTQTEVRVSTRAANDDPLVLTITENSPNIKTQSYKDA